MENIKYDKEKILLLRKEGKSLRDIAKIIGCSAGNVQFHCGYKPNNKCVICGKLIYIRECNNNSHNACSIACRNKWFSKERSPTWKGGLVRKKIRDRQREKRLGVERKIKAINLLGGACSLCGFDGCIASFDFHHKNPKDKIKKGLHGLRRGNWEKFLKELEKCILLCANCHRELHWNEKHKEDIEWIKTLRDTYRKSTQANL